MQAPKIQAICIRELNLNMCKLFLANQGFPEHRIEKALQKVVSTASPARAHIEGYYG